jgi:uncharacterized protein YjbI with pentapeptide repeats
MGELRPSSVRQKCGKRNDGCVILASGRHRPVEVQQRIVLSVATRRRRIEVATENVKPCPICGEEIKQAAKKCIHCNEFLEQSRTNWLSRSWTEIAEEKTLWDFLTLMIVPAVLAIVVFNFSNVQSNRQNAIEAERIQEATLQKYFDEMSFLLLDKQLRSSESYDAVRDVARAWTTITLHELDGGRKGTLLRFLAEAGLIEGRRGETILSLSEADLRDADLRGAYMLGANLNAADMSDADLSRASLLGAYLVKTNLHHANIRRATLTQAVMPGADLSSADLSEATLDWADLSDADLSNAVLHGANLTGTDLSKAKLAGTDFRGADLTGTDPKWHDVAWLVIPGKPLAANLSEATYTDDTQWPDGFTPPPDAIKEE